MKNETNQGSSRRKFLFLGVGTVAFFSLFKWGLPKKKSKTVKMLTQDGRLVELNEDQLPSKRKKITTPELRSWVKGK